jgi:hypothetical protein
VVSGSGEGPKYHRAKGGREGHLTILLGPNGRPCVPQRDAKAKGKSLTWDAPTQKRKSSRASPTGRSVLALLTSRPRAKNQGRTARGPSALSVMSYGRRSLDRMVMSRYRVESELRDGTVPHPLEHPLRTRHLTFDAGKFLAEPFRTKPTRGARGAERNQLRQHTLTPLRLSEEANSKTKSCPDRSCFDG